MVQAATAALAVAGPLMKGSAGYEAGKFNNKVAQIEAADAERDGAAEEARIRETARLAIGQQLSAQGSNGFQMGSGSALDALQQSQINATLDALTARRAAAAKARSARVQGSIAKAQGKNAMAEGVLGALKGGLDWAGSSKASGG